MLQPWQRADRKEQLEVAAIPVIDAITVAAPCAGDAVARSLRPLHRRLQLQWVHSCGTARAVLPRRSCCGVGDGSLRGAAGDSRGLGIVEVRVQQRRRRATGPLVQGECSAL